MRYVRAYMTGITEEKLLEEHVCKDMKETNKVFRELCEKYKKGDFIVKTERHERRITKCSHCDEEPAIWCVVSRDGNNRRNVEYLYMEAPPERTGDTYYICGRCGGEN